MTGLYDWLYKASSGWAALISLGIFVAFTALVLPDQAKSASEVSGDARTPDLSFFYTPNELLEMAESYGEDGRDAYIKARFTFDLAWPVVYILFLATSISWVFQRAFTPGSRLWKLNVVPLIGALFDYLENISTSLVMFRYPQRIPGIELLASAFTPLKWIFVSGAFVLLLVGIVVAVRKGVGKKGAQ
jgi:hypothetical protein